MTWSFGGAFAMYEASTDLKADRRPKKTQKEVNQRFRDNHQLIQVSFKKESKKGDKNRLSEYEVLIKNARRYSNSLGRYIRDCALEPRIKVIEKRPLFDEKVFHELHKIGVNINQIAYKVNAKPDENEFPVFGKTLEGLDQKLNEILETIRSKW